MKMPEYGTKFKRLLSIFILALCLFVGAEAKSSSGVVHVRGYTKKDGTYVAPHDRTAPNHTKNDNWSTKGNINPETGKAGTKPGDGQGTSTTTSFATQSGGVNASHTQSETTGWSAMKSGLKDSEVTKQLGTPKDVQKKNGYEIWNYPTGIVYVKEGKVVGWRQTK
jgi:hypothetical protein